MAILLTFECLIEGGIAINIIIVILQAFITYGGLTNYQIVEHVMFLRVDGVSIPFQMVKYGDITLMRTQQLPYLIKIHCMAHKTNLAMQTLFFIPMVSILEDLL